MLKCTNVLLVLVINCDYVPIAQETGHTALSLTPRGIIDSDNNNGTFHFFFNTSLFPMEDRKMRAVIFFKEADEIVGSQKTFKDTDKSWES